MLGQTIVTEDTFEDVNNVIRYIPDLGHQHWCPGSWCWCCLLFVRALLSLCTSEEHWAHESWQGPVWPGHSTVSATGNTTPWPCSVISLCPVSCDTDCTQIWAQATQDIVGTDRALVGTQGTRLVCIMSRDLVPALVPLTSHCHTTINTDGNI